MFCLDMDNLLCSSNQEGPLRGRQSQGNVLCAPTRARRHSSDCQAMCLHPFLTGIHTNAWHGHRLGITPTELQCFNWHLLPALNHLLIPSPLQVPARKFNVAGACNTSGPLPPDACMTLGCSVGGQEFPSGAGLGSGIFVPRHPLPSATVRPITDPLISEKRIRITTLVYKYICMQASAPALPGISPSPAGIRM